ncbi:MAG: transporter substrate-binding domain-containing protein [Clostridia bacterium]|nr:transporter substrate-binding domain-containing protein [Clostridia bacterium]
MKKLIAFVLSLMLVLTAVAALAETTETKGTLVMATNASFPPYEYYDGETIVGIDAEIAAAIAAYLGYDFRIDDMEFDSIIPAVDSGKADFGLAGMTVTEERMLQVDFSDSYATGVQVVIVKEGSPIASVDDLSAEGANYTIGVQLSTTGDLYCTWDLEDYGLATVNRYPNGNEAVQALLTGKVDCVVIDNEPAKAYVAANPGLKILETAYAIEDYAACFKKGNPLRDEFNTALNALIEDGTIPAIIEKYIPSEQKAEEPAAE